MKGFQPTLIAITVVLFVLAGGCNAPCPEETADLEQEALRLALIDYFTKPRWKSGPYYLKKNEFTVADEYPLADGQPPAQVIDLATLKELAKGEPFGPSWTIPSYRRKSKDGRELIYIQLTTTRENLDKSNEALAMSHGKSFLYEIKGLNLNLINSSGWRE